MNNNSIKDKMEDLKEWVSDHAKIVMPVILLICVFITVAVAVNANKKMAQEVEARTAEAVVTPEVNQAQESTQAQEEMPQLVLEENAYPQVNSLISSYYGALAEGDIEAVVSMNNMVDETVRLRIQEMSKYIDSYPELNVYTKTGPVENSYLAYVYSKVKFTEYDELVPGMQAFYICTDENGACYINEKEDNSEVADYIREVSLQDDVVDLNNQVAVEYNEQLEGDDELKAFLADLEKRIDASVGEALAKAEMEAQAAAEAEAALAAADSTEEETEGQEPVIKKVRATDVVNIRSSDSETADKKGKAQIGDEFTLLEEKGNGWSRISFEGSEGYIKSEFLQTVSEEPVDAGGEAPDIETASAAASDEGETSEAAGDTAGQAAASAAGGQTVTVIENVNVRKSASENGERLGLVYIGEKLELVMKQADGWTKIKYKGETAYVKSDYVE